MMTDKMIEAMLAPGFFPHLVKGPGLLQTHISWVILTGEYAYKIKKPVKFDFLDFSTRAKRKEYTHLEFELNKKFAPDLYISVLPVYLNDGQYSLNGSGEPVEYCLKMREFPQEAVFTRLFENGRLDEKTMAQLGAKVAGLHKRADRAPAGFGSVDKIRKISADNYHESLPFAGQVVSAATLEKLNDWSSDFISNHRGMLENRISEGMISDCHGDLHLNNLCMFEDKIQVFDCIEFNPDFRFIDRIYDVAFAFMDLISRNRKDLAYAYINSWLMETGDYSGACLLPFYSFTRAMIRAKVYAFMLNDPGFEAAERNGIIQKSSGFYGLAEKFAGKTSGKVYIMCGLSGSGKSTVASYLAGHKGAVQIRSDAVRKHLAGVNLYEKGPVEIYSREMSEKTYASMEENGLQIAVNGLDVILDAKYDLYRLRRKVIEQCRDLNLECTVIYCSASEAAVLSRLRERRNDISDATAELMARQISEMEEPGGDEKNCTCVIDTEKEWQREIERLFLS